MQPDGGRERSAAGVVGGHARALWAPVWATTNSWWRGEHPGALVRPQTQPALPPIAFHSSVDDLCGRGGGVEMVIAARLRMARVTAVEVDQMTAIGSSSIERRLVIRDGPGWCLAIGQVSIRLDPGEGKTH